MRLDRFLSNCKVASRRDVKKIIKSGEITINGRLTVNVNDKIDENNDVVCCNGKTINYEKYVYLMMNKPSGVISATHDRTNQTVISLLPEKFTKMGVFPVGRLDKDTTGLLILSNDGNFAHNVLSPKKKVYKKYYAEVDKPLSEEDVLSFREGIDIGGYVCEPSKLQIAGENEAFVSICEGKFHQVKKMFESAGKRVVSLKRVEFGGVTLDERLKPGEYRALSGEELETLGVGQRIN